MRDGTWQRVLQALQGRADQEGNLVWQGCALDSTGYPRLRVIKVHPHAAGARKAPAKKGALVLRRVRRKRWAQVEAG